MRLQSSCSCRNKKKMAGYIPKQQHDYLKLVLHIDGLPHYPNALYNSGKCSMIVPCVCSCADRTETLRHQRASTREEWRAGFLRWPHAVACLPACPFPERTAEERGKLDGENGLRTADNARKAEGKKNNGEQAHCNLQKV
jgi:hypothetical protein